jgi:3-hydroxyisobutyrate dehydrogenase
MKVGIVGTGLMGSQIAERLLEIGYEVFIYNRNKNKARSLIKKGGIWASSSRELGEKCKLVILCLTDGAATKEVCLGSDGLLNYSKGDLVVGNLSTISPTESAEIAQIMKRRKIHFFQMPVMGGPDLARKGELIAILSGEKGCVDRNMKIIRDIARTVFYVGKTDGLANYIKLALNLNIAMIGIALSESIIYIRKAGLDPNIFVEILNSTYFKTSLSEKKGPKMVKNNFEPRFHLRNMLKDLRLLTDSISALGISLPFSNLSEQLFLAANNSGYSELDYTAILAFLQDLNRKAK